MQGNWYEQSMKESVFEKIFSLQTNLVIQEKVFCSLQKTRTKHVKNLFLLHYFLPDIIRMQDSSNHSLVTKFLSLKLSKQFFYLPSAQMLLIFYKPENYAKMTNSAWTCIVKLL